VKNQHISLVDSSKGSRFWKMLINSIPLVIDKSFWRVKEGNLSFWRDKWMESGPICQKIQISDLPLLKIKDCMVDHSWDVDLVVQLVGQEVADDIFAQVDGTKPGMDRLIWLGNRDGSFSTKSVWDWLRISVPKQQWTNWIWHSALPKKISVIVWKAMTNSLSVDDRIRRIGVSIASKCECCPQGDIEDLDHVLYSGKIAANLWKMCSSFLGMPYVATRSWLGTVEAWFRRSKKSTKVGNLIGLIPSIITWNLWIWRCSARMEGQKDCFNVLWRKVKYWIYWVGLRLRDTGNLHHRDQAILQELNLPTVSHAKSRFIAVAWEKPELGWFKLNTDGSSLENPGISGAGGLTRDHTGNLIFAFSEYIGIGSNNKAELLGVLIGLRKCKAMGLHNIVVKLDSSLLVTWFEKGSCRVWYLEDFWEEIVFLLSGLNTRIKHVLREGNQAADWLSKSGSAGITHDYTSNNIPKELKGILRIDKCGLSCLRIK